MSVDLGQFDRAKEEKTWLILSTVSDLESLDSQVQISTEELFTPPIARRMAELFLRLSCKPGKASFLTDEQLFDIASEARKPGKLELRANIAAASGIYIFVGLQRKTVFKVGQADDMQKRIVTGHLRHRNQYVQSELVGFFESRGEAWPGSLQEQEITLLCFPMHRSSEDERCLIERGLQELLTPEMP